MKSWWACLAAHWSAAWRKWGKSAVEIYGRTEPTAADFTLNGSFGSFAAVQVAAISSIASRCKRSDALA